MNTVLRVVVIAQQGLQEAWHGRFYLLLVAVVAVCALLGAFAGELVLIGSEGTRLAVYNFTLRLALVAVCSIHIIQSLLRDRIDKQTEVLLSLDMPREVYVFGRLLGFIVVLFLAVALAAVFPLWQVDPVVTAGWALSLFAELAIVACLSVFVAISMNNPAVCFSLVAGVYLLARSMGNLLLLSHSPIVQTGETGLEVAKLTLKLINILLPDLWRFAPSEWLLDNAIDPSMLGVNLLSAGLFCVLLAIAGSFDLHRKNL